jgi:hypothetical protein
LNQLGSLLNIAFVYAWQLANISKPSDLKADRVIESGCQLTVVTVVVFMVFLVDVLVNWRMVDRLLLDVDTVLVSRYDELRMNRREI